MTTNPTAFSVENALELADHILSLRPERAWINRASTSGVRVYRFALPLELCRTRNADRHRPGWSVAKNRQDVYDRLYVQAYAQGWRMHKPSLPGRQHLVSIRFSSSESDPGSDGEKQAIDCLQPPKTRDGRLVSGLGILRGDRGSELKRDSWWEPAPRGSGFQYLEIWSG